MKKLEIGDKVRMQKGHRNWVQAKVLSETEFPRSVIVRTKEGKCYRRNNHHLRRSKEDIPPKVPMRLQSTKITQGIKHQQQTKDKVTAENHQKTTRSGRMIKPVRRYGND